jgi:hypothetical protein
MSPASKKRKHQEAAEDQREVPDSQELKVEGRSIGSCRELDYVNEVIEAEVSARKLSTPKRRRGRPQRRSRLSSHFNASPDVEPNQSQSFSSVDEGHSC